MKELKISRIIEIIAIALTIIAIVVHSEALWLLIMTAGTLWCIGFIASAIAGKKEGF